MASRKFSVTMGQAFRDELPEILANIGGRVGRARFDYGETIVTVPVSFRNPTTVGRIQRQLWKLWPACSIEVKERP